MSDGAALAIDAHGDERYVVVSSDCHGGGNVLDYRPYLESSWLDEFDAWAAEYEVPYDDLKGDNGERNWDSVRRTHDLEMDGIVAEVIFPNTVPPFFPKVSLTTQPPALTAADMERRWAGLRAHNRWLTDFCLATPGQRARGDPDQPLRSRGIGSGDPTCSGSWTDRGCPPSRHPSRSRTSPTIRYGL